MIVRRLMVMVLSLSPFLLTGCEIDTKDIRAAGGAIDRFSAQLEKTTHPEKGHLKQLLNDLKRDLNELVKNGEKIKDDTFIQFALERKNTIQDILDLTKKIFGDTRVLMREVQGGMLSGPLQIDDTLSKFRVDLRDDLAQLVAVIPFARADAPITFSGLDWTSRPSGYYSVAFTIPDASKLRLKVGGTVVTPEYGGAAGKVMYKVPIDASIKTQFRDMESMPLGFLLIDPKGKVRHGGQFQLQPRFPLKYEFRVYPADGKTGVTVAIESGPALDDIVRMASGADVPVATRHGDIYRLAKLRLAFGTSTVEVPEGCHWELKLTFPDGTTSPLLQPGNRHVKNEKRTVTVHGPNRKENVWTLQIDVENQE